LYVGMQTRDDKVGLLSIAGLKLTVGQRTKSGQIAKCLHMSYVQT